MLLSYLQYNLRSACSLYAMLLLRLAQCTLYSIAIATTYFLVYAIFCNLGDFFFILFSYAPTDFDRYLNLCNLLCHNANKARNKMELHMSLSIIHVEHMKIGMYVLVQ